MNSSPKSDTWIGRAIGENQRYCLTQRLGGGGMGDVFVAIDTKLGQQMALKILKSNWAETEELRRRFEHEVALCAALRGDHVVHVSDYGITPEGYPFYVMEYLKGQTLGQLMRREKRLPVERSVKLITQVCDGLEMAHHGVTLHQRSARIKIVHRDLKPENIFLANTALGELVKILDFGIAKIHHEQGENTHQTRLFIGTFHYASPEQIEVKQEIDGRSDIYSLGIILYEMLAGIDPFGLGIESNSISQMSWAIAHASKTPIPLRSQPDCGHFPPALEAIVMRCLEKQPADRFTSVTELGHALYQVGVAVSQPGVPASLPRSSPAEHEIPTDRGVPSPITAPPSDRPSPRSVGQSIGQSLDRWKSQGAEGAVAAAERSARQAVPTPAPSGRTLNHLGSNYPASHPDASLPRTNASWLESVKSLARGLSPIRRATIVGFGLAIAVFSTYLVVSRLSSSSPKPSPASAQVALEKAKTSAKQGKLVNALASVSRIPRSNPDYAEAQKLIKQWSQQLLANTEQEFRTANSKEALQKALASLRVLPSSSPIDTEVQNRSKQWQQEWRSAEQKLTQAKEAQAAGRWEQVLKATDGMPNIAFWQQQANLLNQNAKTALSAPAAPPQAPPQAPPVETPPLQEPERYRQPESSQPAPSPVAPAPVSSPQHSQPSLPKNPTLDFSGTPASPPSKKPSTAPKPKLPGQVIPETGSPDAPQSEGSSTSQPSGHDSGDKPDNKPDKGTPEVNQSEVKPSPPADSTVPSGAEALKLSTASPAANNKTSTVRKDVPKVESVRIPANPDGTAR